MLTRLLLMGVGEAAGFNSLQGLGKTSVGYL